MPWTQIAVLKGTDGVDGEDGADAVLGTTLTQIDAITGSNNDLIQKKSGVWVNRSLAQLLSDLGIASNYQPLDADLTAIAGLSASNDDFLQRKSGNWTNRTIAQVRADLNQVKPYAPVTLSDGASVSLDASLGTHFRLNAAGNRTISAPSNPTDGQVIVIEHYANTSARTLTLTTGSSGAFLFGSDITALTQTAAGKTDLIQAVYSSSAARWWVIGYVKGF